MKKSPLQFSLAALLLTVAAIAGVLALMFRVPTIPARGTLIVVIYVLSALVLTGFAFGQPALRAYCIGAIVPLASLLFFISPHLAGLLVLLASDNENATAPFDMTFLELLFVAPGVQRLLGVGILMSIASGYLCVGFRWLIERREPPEG